MALLFRRMLVRGPSMIPAVASGQRLFVGRLPYLLAPPARGDVVVVRHPTRHGFLLVKRIVGVPGDRIELSPDVIVVRGESAARAAERSEPTADHAATLGAREILVAGDAAAGEDSRSFGPVPMTSIVGRAWWSYWPPDRWGTIPRAVSRPPRGRTASQRASVKVGRS